MPIPDIFTNRPTPAGVLGRYRPSGAKTSKFQSPRTTALVPAKPPTPAVGAATPLASPTAPPPAPPAWPAALAQSQAGLEGMINLQNLVNSIQAQQPSQGLDALGGLGGPPQTGSSVVNTALQQVGKTYTWGAENPKVGFDCSGLAWWALSNGGQNKSVPRLTADGYWNSVKHINKDQLQPGDLVFYNYGRLAPGHADHIGIYMGNGQMVAASSSADQVRTQAIDWTHLMGFGRYNG